MIQQLILKNFRNFTDSCFDFWHHTYISGKNGSGKTNILEAISLFSDPLLDIDISNMVSRHENNLYIEARLNDGKILAISYDKESWKKKYLSQGKATTKSKIKSLTSWAVLFHPLEMNMMYLWPSKRREFLDTILSNTYDNYAKTLKKYKKVVSSRNKVLKNISEGKSSRSEIEFWDQEFILLATEIYNYRIKLIEHFVKNTSNFTQYLSHKVNSVEFSYQSKIDIYSPETEITQYLKQNLERDILMRKTPIWPHVDDFDIVLDNQYSLINFGSRWEVKSCIIWLKLLESGFRSEHTQQNPIFLIDDLLSELDTPHLKMLMEHVDSSQTLITSIELIENTETSIYL